MGCNVKLLLWGQIQCHLSQPNFELHVTFTPTSETAFGKGGILGLGFRKTGQQIAAFTLEQMCRLFYLKRAVIYRSPVLDVLARPSTQEVGCGGGLAASYTRTSTDSDSSLLSSRIRISSDWNRLGPDSFSLIISTTVSLNAQNGTELPAKSRSSSRCCRYKSICFLRCVVGVGWALQWLALVRTWLWCAVIGSGVHVTMMAMVDNASGIDKTFMK